MEPQAPSTTSHRAAEKTAAEEYGLADPKYGSFEPRGSDNWSAPSKHLAALSASDLFAVRRASSWHLGALRPDEPLIVEYSLVDPAYFNDDSPTEWSELVVWPRSVDLRLTTYIDDAACNGGGPPAWVTKLLRRIARRHGLRLLGTNTESFGGACWLRASLRVPRDARLASVLTFVDQIDNAMQTAPEDQSLQSLWGLFQDGLVESIVGVCESDWLEAKSAPYDLTDVISRLELAKDISAMANSGGGMIVLGYGTHRIAAVDTVHTIRPCPSSLIEPDRYRRALRGVLYPPPSGLEFRYQPVTAERGVLGICVPAQPSASLPILVVGMPGRSHGRIEGNYVGLFQRYAESNLPTVPSTIHRALNRIYGQ